MVDLPFFITLPVIGLSIGWFFAIWFGFYRATQTSMIDAGKKRSLLVVGMLFMAVWLVLAFVLSITGFFAGFFELLPVPHIVTVAIPLLLVLIAFAFNANLQRAVAATPQVWLVGVQVFRIIGVIFLMLWARGEMPAEFALSAGWGDVFIGVTAPVVAYLLWKKMPASKWVAIVWNLLGMTDLITAVTLGILTSPNALQQFAMTKPNVLISAYPISLIPTWLVPTLFLLHVFSLYGLLKKQG